MATAVRSASLQPHPLHQRLHMLAQARVLAGQVEAQGLAHRTYGFQKVMGPASVHGVASALAYGQAQASGRLVAMPGRTEAAFTASATGLVMAETSVTAQALGVISANLTAQASAAATAHIEGRAIIGESEVGVEASAGVAARAQASAKATGAANLGIIQAHGTAGVAAEASAEASAHGRAWVGIDSLGLPAFALGAAARTDVVAGVRTHAEGGVSLLGLIELGGSGSLKGMAGAASSFLGSIGFRDGKLSVGAGLGAAAGLGGEAQAGVSVGLGKLPRGITQTVVAPVLSVPVLLANTVVNGVGSLFGETPWEGAPDITDLPKVVVTHVTNGAKTIAKGAEEVAEQVVGAAKTIAKGAEAAAKGVAKGAVAAADGVVDGVKWLGRQIGSLFD